ncbi:MAG: hypothetical protein QF733_00020 [Phycisphaerales bacterium]|nr:hypothetical protein [Phycisphaerales bacterium]
MANCVRAYAVRAEGAIESERRLDGRETRHIHASARCWRPQFADLAGRAVHHDVPTCGGDLDGAGLATVSDITGVLDRWGERGLSPVDLNQDREVDIQDVLVVTGYWGPCP